MQSRMGKSSKGRSHLNTGYPYNPIRVANLQNLGSRLDQKDAEAVRLSEPHFSPQKESVKRSFSTTSILQRQDSKAEYISPILGET